MTIYKIYVIIKYNNKEQQKPYFRKVRCNIENLRTREKVLGVTICLFAVTVIATYFSWLLGFQGFLLVGKIEVPILIQSFVSSMLFYATFLPLAGISLNEYSLKLIGLTLPFMIIASIVCSIITETFFMSMIAPVIYILLIGLLRKDFKNTFKRNIVTDIIVILYQIPTLFVKLNFLPLNQNNVPTFQQWAYTVDFVVFMIILFLFGGGIVHGKYLFSTKSKETNGCCNENSEIFKEFNSLGKCERAFTMVLFFGIQILQLIIILLICNLIGSITMKLLVIMASFLLHGLFLKERWHSNSIIVCTLLSSSMFFVAASLTPSFFTFQLIPIIMGLLLVYSLYKIKIMQDKKTFTKWKENIKEFTQGKYANIANQKEVALAKGLSKRDLMLLNYRYTVNDEFAQLLAKLSPWNDGKFIKIEQDSEEEDPL